jgi:prepilin-type processing-associated H-X9-DG protein
MNAFASSSRKRSQGFSLTELLTLVGLVTVLLSLLIPVISKVRAAASNTTCLSNVRQMGAAWTAYTMENHGRLPDYVWYTPDTPDFAWNGYWLGILDKNSVRGESLLCPAAREEASDRNGGFGDVTHAWTGRYSKNGTVVRVSQTTYRTGSYGYNRYLTAGGGFGRNKTGTTLGALTNWSATPVLFDCVYADAKPLNGIESAPVRPPPDLTGAGVTEDSQVEHWRFLIGRHGRGINVYMADGSAKWVRLDDLYLLSWNGDWSPYLLRLPRK